MKHTHCIWEFVSKLVPHCSELKTWCKNLLAKFIFTVPALKIYRLSHHLKENLPQVKALKITQKTFQRHHGPRGFPPRDSTVCHRSWWVVGVCTTRVFCEPAALHPALAICAFCLLVLSKVRPLWKILALLIILEDCSRHIFRRDAVSFVCIVHPGKRVSLPKSNLVFSPVFSIFFLTYFFFKCTIQCFFF